MRRELRIGALAVLGVCLVDAGRALALVHTFHADLDGLQMVPPNASPAFGAADLTLDDTNGAMTITSGTYQDLLGGSNSVLLNSGAIGTNGAFIQALTNDTPGAATGTFSGGGTLAAGPQADMLAGNTYIRVTSQVFPSGEIRGQLFEVPEPTAIAILAAGGMLALRRRHRHA